MPNKFVRWVQTLNYPSYVIFFVTARCNARCKMCFYQENMLQNRGRTEELTVAEFEQISQKIKRLNILGISGGEPFLREDLAEIVKVLYRHCAPLVVDLPTNGFFSDKVAQQVAQIAGDCPEMVVDLQLSIDGPEKIHNEIRGLADGFKRVKETYHRVIALKKKYRNLKVKACTVYSAYNQDVIAELFDILARDFSELDRVVFSVAHGSVSDAAAMHFDWAKYFAFCDKIRKTATVKRLTDVHSIFTMALRMVKNDYLQAMLQTKDMYRRCGAGQKVVAIGESGEVFPCEPLWHSVGNLRDNDYDLNRILQSERMQAFRQEIAARRCTCHWGLPMSNTLLYSPAYYPRIIWEMGRILKRSIRTL